MSGPAAYIDSSALVKLIHPEPESAALRRALLQWPILVGSDLLFIETMRTSRRLTPPQHRVAERVLSTVRLIPIAEAVKNFAAGVGPPELRTLDAIHLATAELLRGRLGVFFVYDTRLLQAALRRQLPVASPT